MRHRVEKDSIFPYMAAVAYNYLYLLKSYITLCMLYSQTRNTQSYIHSNGYT